MQFHDDGREHFVIANWDHVDLACEDHYETGWADFLEA